MIHPFFTIGHATRPVAEFVTLLRDADVELIVDVRTVPRSRKNPQYNRDTFPTTLTPFDVGYLHIPELGGLRGRSPVPSEVNGFWENESFHNYADYAMSDQFQEGLSLLRKTGHARRCAIMCAEVVWWRCHRRIITDYLIAAGETVFHILGPGRTDLARRTEVAVSDGSGALVYPDSQTPTKELDR